MKTLIPARVLASAFTVSQLIAAPIAHYTFDVDDGGTTPDADPGMVDDCGEFVPTDPEGDAKVRLTLTGDPKDFVRAVSLP